MIIWLSILTGTTTALLVAVAILFFKASQNTSPDQLASQVASLRLTVADITDRIEQIIRREKTIAARQSKEKGALNNQAPDFSGMTPKQALRARMAQGLLFNRNGASDQ